MHEMRPGFWVPDRSSWIWMTKHGGESQVSQELLEACVEACGDRLDLAIDGGAFVGSLTLRLASVFERVVAYEPIQENFECLERNVTSLPGIVDKVEVCRCALSDRVGPMHRSRPDLKAYGQRVQHNTSNAAWLEFYGVPLDITGVTGVDLLKLDVEGHEYEALVGAQDTIKASRPVVVVEEKHDPNKRATQFLKKLGMVCTWSRRHDYLFTWPT